MSHVTPRWVLGTLRLRFVTPFKRLRALIRRRPRSSRVVPRPAPLAPGRQALELTHVVVASDLNERYLASWPLARRAWPAVASLQPVLVLVAHADEVPAELRGDPSIHRFEPLEGVHTALQAQSIRLLYPALLPEDAGVLTADVDMLPLDARYFHANVAHVDQDHFVAYRDVLLREHQIPICFNAARPRTWSELFEVESIDDVRAQLARWTSGLDYDGVRGGAGWDTDQRILYRRLLDWGRATRRAWILSDFDTRHARLDRGVLEKPRALTREQEARIRAHGYSDFHCLLPQSEFRELNERVLELAGG